MAAAFISAFIRMQLADDVQIPAAFGGVGALLFMWVSVGKRSQARQCTGLRE